MKEAIYPGSFDPITFGHIDIIKRAARIVDRLVVCVLTNPQKKPLFSREERVNMIDGVLRENGLTNVVIDTNEGLLVDYAKDRGINTIIRGLRAVTDFEYELQIAQVNRRQMPEFETVFLLTSLEYSYLSSSLVKEFAYYKGDLTKFVPASIIPQIEAKYK